MIKLVFELFDRRLHAFQNGLPHAWDGDQFSSAALWAKRVVTLQPGKSTRSCIDREALSTLPCSPDIAGSPAGNPAGGLDQPFPNIRAEKGGEAIWVPRSSAGTARVPVQGVCRRERVAAPAVTAGPAVAAVAPPQPRPATVVLGWMTKS